jgi:DNA gyrase subunit B
MPQLLEKGHVYIAQPPLYKIKRGKREEYIDTETKMDDLLLELGSEGMSLTRTEKKKTFTDKQLKAVLDILVEVASFEKPIGRRGVNFSNYLAFRHPKTKKLPLYRAKVDGEYQYLYNDDELAECLEIEEKKGSKAKEGVSADKAKEVDLIEFFEARELEKIIDKLQKMGIDISGYEAPKKEKKAKKKTKKKEAKKQKAPYKLEFEKGTKDIYSLKELLEYVKECGRHGMTIQRYKGLGEMNPAQLWHTTMDPENRSLIRITIEDVIAADEIFTLLMGDKVEPRRNFIQKNALEVQELDV